MTSRDYEKEKPSFFRGKFSANHNQHQQGSVETNQNRSLYVINVLSSPWLMKLARVSTLISFHRTLINFQWAWSSRFSTRDSSGLPISIQIQLEISSNKRPSDLKEFFCQLRGCFPEVKSFWKTARPNFQPIQPVRNFWKEGGDSHQCWSSGYGYRWQWAVRLRWNGITLRKSSVGDKCCFETRDKNCFFTISFPWFGELSWEGHPKTQCVGWGRRQGELFFNNSIFWASDRTSEGCSEVVFWQVGLETCRSRIIRLCLNFLVCKNSKNEF